MEIQRTPRTSWFPRQPLRRRSRRVSPNPRTLKEPAQSAGSFRALLPASRGRAYDPAMATSEAAFFDLDRTLLRGASGPVFSEMLKTVGVIPDRSIPGEGFVYRIFDVIGETLPSMLLTRQAARVASGWNRSSVQEAGRRAAERLVDQVPPHGQGVDRAAP